MSHPGGLKVALGLATVALMFAGSPPRLDAQTTSASVTGSVQDSQSGMLPGATVTLTSRTQGNVLTAVTDEAGRFVFPIVRPDTYSMKVTLQGFKTLERTTVVVNANDKLSAGMLTMQVGNLTEEVSVSSRVTEVQSTSGERAFTLESEALKNMGNNGRLLFGLATLAPGVLSQNTGGSEIGSVGGITVNGQRPNSNNITIDGVSNIDTGDNGGNMATTNVDAVAEFKILTNAYQAEYGRAVGGQMQVVTKSGTQQFRGSGYWFGRRSDWDANTWLNNRESLPKAETSRNDSGYTIGGPVYFPGFNTDKKRLFFFWSQEYQRRSNPAGLHQTRVPTALERQGDFSQSVDSSGNPFPYIRDATTGLPCSAANTSGCFQDGGVLGRIPANRLYAPGINALNIYPTANYSGGSGLNFQSQDPDSPKRREDLLRMDFQATNNWRITGRYMHNNEDILQAYGTTWAGNGSDQLPTPTLFVHPGSNYMLSATGVLNSTTSLEVSWGRASNSLNYNLQLDPLFRKNANVSALPLLFPDAAQADYVPWFVFRGGRTNNAGQYQTDRGPFTNENITHDVIANVTKVWGSHASKGGFYYQNSFKPQSIFASFNSQIDFTDNTNNPFDTGFSYANAATGVFNFYQQANKYALPEWRYHNFEWYGQDNWKPNRRLTLDYGLRFYYMTPQWDTTLQASNFLPDQFNQANAAKLYFPVCIGAPPCDGDARRAMDPKLIAQGVTPTVANTVEGRFIGRLTPGSDRFNGAFQAGQGINDQLQDGNAFRLSPRLGVVYDLSGTGETILRGGWGIFYDRPQGNQVFDMIANAPGVLNSRLDFGTLQSLTPGAGADPNPTLSLAPSAFDFKPPKVTQWNIGIQHKVMSEIIVDLAYVGSTSKDLLRQVQINALPFGATFQQQNQDPTRAPSAVLGSSALPNDFLRPYPGYGDIRMWDYSGYSNYHALQTSVSRRFDRGFSFNGFWVWSKALGINSTDFAAGVPNLSDAATRRLDYSLLDYDRPHNILLSSIYQLPSFTSSKVLGLLINEWQLSGAYRWTSGRPYGVGFNISGISAQNLTGTDGNPNARIVLTCDPGGGSSSDPYRQINTACFAQPQPHSDGAESSRFFLHSPPINNLDMSVSKRVTVYGKSQFEFRVDIFNALNHTQFTGVNATANFDSLTNPAITNLPYDASGALTQRNGFGTINGVAPPRSLQLVMRFTF